MNRSILVPLDGSALAEQALPHAATLARKMGSGLTLARVVTAITLRGDDPQEALRLALAEAESYLTRTAERLRSEGLDVAVVVDDGEPPAVIMAITHRLPTACIVMSTHGRSGVGRWLFGSVAETVLAESSVPVFLIPADCGRAWPVSRALRVLVPLDGSELAEAALTSACQLAATPGAELHLVRVVRLLGDENLDGPGLPSLGLRHELATVRRYLDSLAGKLWQQGTVAEVHLRLGDIADEIAETVREQAIDLIVMTRPGNEGPSRAQPGSVAMGAFRRVCVPVLFVSPRQAVASADRPEVVTLPG